MKTFTSLHFKSVNKMSALAKTTLLLITMDVQSEFKCKRLNVHLFYLLQLPQTKTKSKQM